MHGEVLALVLVLAVHILGAISIHDRQGHMDVVVFQDGTHVASRCAIDGFLTDGQHVCYFFALGHDLLDVHFHIGHNLIAIFFAM